MVQRSIESGDVVRGAHRDVTTQTFRRPNSFMGRIAAGVKGYGKGEPLVFSEGLQISERGVEAVDVNIDARETYMHATVDEKLAILLAIATQKDNELDRQRSVYMDQLAPTMTDVVQTVTTEHKMNPVPRPLLELLNKYSSLVEAIQSVQRTCAELLRERSELVAVIEQAVGYAENLQRQAQAAILELDSVSHRQYTPETFKRYRSGPATEWSEQGHIVSGANRKVEGQKGKTMLAFDQIIELIPRTREVEGRKRAELEVVDKKLADLEKYDCVRLLQHVADLELESASVDVQLMAIVRKFGRAATELLRLRDVQDGAPRPQAIVAGSSTVLPPAMELLQRMSAGQKQIEASGE